MNKYLLFIFVNLWLHFMEPVIRLLFPLFHSLANGNATPVGASIRASSLLFHTHTVPITCTHCKSHHCLGSAATRIVTVALLSNATPAFATPKESLEITAPRHFLLFRMLPAFLVGDLSSGRLVLEFHVPRNTPGLV